MCYIIFINKTFNWCTLSQSSWSFCLFLFSSWFSGGLSWGSSWSFCCLCGICSFLFFCFSGCSFSFFLGLSWGFNFFNLSGCASGSFHCCFSLSLSCCSICSFDDSFIIWTWAFNISFQSTIARHTVCNVICFSKTSSTFESDWLWTFKLNSSCCLWGCGSWCFWGSSGWCCFLFSSCSFWLFSFNRSFFFTFICTFILWFFLISFNLNWWSIILWCLLFFL